MKAKRCEDWVLHSYEEGRAYNVIGPDSEPGRGYGTAVDALKAWQVLHQLAEEGPVREDVLLGLRRRVYWVLENGDLAPDSTPRLEHVTLAEFFDAYLAARDELAKLGPIVRDSLIRLGLWPKPLDGG